MKTLSKFILKLIMSILIFGLFFGGSCEEDPVTPQEEHFDAVGLVVYQSGLKIIDYYAPDYTPNVTAINDTINIDQGLTPHYEVKFYDENKNEIDPPTESDKAFGMWVQDMSVVSIWWHPGDEGKFEFHLNGLKEGSTRVKFQVLHLGHPDFETLPVVVNVSGNVSHGEPVKINVYQEANNTLLASAGISGSGTATGSIILSNGTTTDHMVVKFEDANGVEFFPDAAHHSINLISGDVNIASVTGLEPQEPFAFKLQGNSNGSTTLAIELLHDGSVDLTFAPIPVTVN